MQLRSLAMNERLAVQSEAIQRDLLDRPASLLTPEQVKVYANLLQQKQEAARTWREQQRRSLGLAADEEIDSVEDEAPRPPILSSNVALAIELELNDTKISKTLISKRGGSVSFQGPDGLQFDVVPYLTDSDTLTADLEVYETVRGGRRLVGEVSARAKISPRKGTALNSLGSNSSGTMMRGRKGYAVNWSVTATYL